MNRIKTIYSFLITFIIALFLLSGCGKIEKEQDVLIGITWCDDASSEVYTNVADTLDDMNIKYIMLEQVKSDAVPYDGAKVSFEATAKEGYLLQEYADEVKKNQFEKSNVASTTEKVDGVIFIGGDDVSPTLYKNPEPWHGIEEEKGYNAAEQGNGSCVLRLTGKKENYMTVPAAIRKRRRSSKPIRRANAATRKSSSFSRERQISDRKRAIEC